jgi:hypothetical protein
MEILQEVDRRPPSGRDEPDKNGEWRIAATDHQVRSGSKGSSNTREH